MQYSDSQGQILHSTGRIGQKDSILNPHGSMGNKGDRKMTQEDLATELTPKMNSIENSALRTYNSRHHQVDNNSQQNNHFENVEGRIRQLTSIEREIENKVRARVNDEMQRKMQELNDKQRYLDQTLNNLEVLRGHSREDQNMPSAYQVLLGQYNDLLYRFNQ